MVPAAVGAATNEVDAVAQQSDVTILELEEAVRLDPAYLVALFRDLGPPAAQSVLARAITEIGERLEGLSEPHRSGRWGELARRARALSAIAEQVGMTEFSRVARSVAECAAREDAPALGATLARLDRVAHRSLAAVWDMTGTGA
ncbi:MAG: hypothetical protein AAGJ91_13220 [Pseudomonadota bacterium]